MGRRRLVHGLGKHFQMGQQLVYNGMKLRSLFGHTEKLIYFGVNFKVGKEVGLEVGIALGRVVGLDVGIDVGYKVGTNVVGLRVGARVGGGAPSTSTT